MSDTSISDLVTVGKQMTANYMFKTDTSDFNFFHLFSMFIQRCIIETSNKRVTDAKRVMMSMS